MQRPVTEKVIPHQSQNAPSHAEVKFGTISFANAAKVNAPECQTQPQKYKPAPKRSVADFERNFPKLTPRIRQVGVSLTTSVEVIQTVPELIDQERSSEIDKEEKEISSPEESKDASTEEDISLKNEPSASLVTPSVSEKPKVTKHVTFALVNEVIPMVARSEGPKVIKHIPFAFVKEVIPTVARSEEPKVTKHVSFALVNEVIPTVARSEESKVTKHVTFALVNEVIPMVARSNRGKGRRSRSRKGRSFKKSGDIK